MSVGNERPMRRRRRKRAGSKSETKEEVREDSSGGGRLRNSCAPGSHASVFFLRRSACNPASSPMRGRVGYVYSAVASQRADPETRGWFIRASPGTMYASLRSSDDEY
ncbi:hypothetical protein MTO96_027254 [Rhipicephalus appendiculatus]